ncbi:DUF418 domain-containing protein [Aureibacillus halotolerans]|uniref:DUF418 domain-containing protein n=1 Tax=Aureibacillus halotolerans TaxID=1508390 RepID=A0A4R6U1V8_9BACI|nr:DUF418 domain-containing protein [Aureibacillus halotolerans]TDQ40388.1 uncharacterized protein EV213_106104 [Aureibacillus halotolerans]
MYNRKESTLPTVRGDRIVELDIIRGVALLGILLANMPLFSYPYPYFELLHVSLWNDSWNRFIMLFLNVAVVNKFITIFSFLFGLGFIIFMERLKLRGERPVVRYVRRLLFLMLLGVLHSTYIWYGDILLIYSVFGFILLLFRNRSPKVLLNCGVALLLVSALLLALQTFAFDNRLAIELAPAEQLEQAADQSITVYQTGSFAEMINQRSTDSDIISVSMFYTAILSLGMFFIGAYAGKRGYFRELDKHRQTVKSAWIWSAAIGLPFLAIQFALKYTIDSTHTGLNLAQVPALLIASPAIAIFYITSLLLLLRTALGQRVLAPFAAVGRMALTNYLLQSIICITIFYSFGFGLFAQVSPWYGLLLAIAIYGLQLVLSNLWLKRYPFGPLEWLWRTATYGKLGANRKR